LVTAVDTYGIMLTSDKYDAGVGRIVEALSSFKSDIERQLSEVEAELRTCVKKFEPAEITGTINTVPSTGTITITQL